MKYMKKVVYLVSVVVAILTAASCQNQYESNYADQVKAEKKLLADYISRQNIDVLEDVKFDSIYAPNQFVHNDLTGLYFQLLDKGTGTDTVAVGDEVIVRYMKYDLTENPDTLFNMSTDDSLFGESFYWGDASSTNYYKYACEAWHEAVGYMKFDGARAKLIVPHRIGFSSDKTPATPYGYEINIRVKKH